MLLKERCPSISLTEVVLLAEFPKVGMHYEQGRSRAIRAAKRQDVSMAKSLINQVRLHEGSKAAGELKRELNRDYSPKR